MLSLAEINVDTESYQFCSPLVVKRPAYGGCWVSRSVSMPEYEVFPKILSAPCNDPSKHA
jgi:hypothetical protein